MATFSQRLSSANPVRAINWAETIGDKDVRLEKLQELGCNWLQRDEPAARAWARQDQSRIA